MSLHHLVQCWLGNIVVRFSAVSFTVHEPAKSGESLYKCGEPPLKPVDTV